MTVFTEIFARLADGSYLSKLEKNNKWTNRHSRHWVLIVILMLLAVACSDRPRVFPPDVRLNQAPKEAYDIAVSFEDPPLIERVSGRVQFDIEGTYKKCMPYADRIAGIKPKSSFLKSFQLRRDGSDTYIGRVYADWLLDEDYYGLGLCRWLLTDVQIELIVQGKQQFAGIEGNLVIAEDSRINLCRLPNNGYVSAICRTPVEKYEALRERKLSYVVTIKAMRIQK